MTTTLTGLKLIFALSIFITILLAGWYPFKKHNHDDDHHHGFSIGETLATGIFLGAGLLHMLPDASALFAKQHFHYPFAYLLTGATFLLFLWFEHLVQELYKHKKQHHTHPAFALMAWLMLSIHSLILGAALGLSESHSIIVVLFLAIITHKWAESFAIAIQISKADLPPLTRQLLFLSFALMTPIGMGLGWYFEHDTTNTLIDPILMAASAGTFLYLGTLHGLERCVLVERCCNLADFSFVIIGFLLMGAVAIYL